MSGFVSFVGSGPGDPELLTLKALRALKAADVVLYDSLVTAEVLALARRGAPRICVGKRAGRPSCRQDDINALMGRLARDGKHVVRLKSGDPSVFGRSAEETESLKAAGIDIPIHIGIAGPAKLQTLIKFSIACGVGASLRVLQRRAKDVTKLLLPFEPTDVISELAAHKAANPDFNITNVHFFPLGGIKTNAHWAIENGGTSATPAAAA